MRSFTALLVASSLLAAPLRAHADPPAVDGEDPTATPQPAKPPEPTPRRVTPAPRSCTPIRGYFEPSVLAAAGTPGVGMLGRAALGLRLYGCDVVTGDDTFAIRIGGTFSLRGGRLGFGPASGAGGASVYPAGGGELEVTVPISGHHIGVRAGLEDYNGRMTTLGVRLRDGGPVYALDAFYSQSTDYTSLARTHDEGVMLGLGGDVHLGTAGFLGTLGLAALVAFVSLSVYAGGGD
jgi:hypothetical protein